MSLWPETDPGESHTLLTVGTSSWIYTGPKLRSSELTSGMLVELLGWRKSFCWVSQRSNFKGGAAGGSLYIKGGRICLRIKPTQKKTNMQWLCSDHLSPLIQPCLKPSPPWTFQLYELIHSLLGLSQSKLGFMSCNPKYYTAQYISFWIWTYLWPHAEPGGI